MVFGKRATTGGGTCQGKGDGEEAAAVAEGSRRRSRGRGRESAEMGWLQCVGKGCDAVRPALVRDSYGSKPPFLPGNEWRRVSNPPHALVPLLSLEAGRGGKDPLS